MSCSTADPENAVADREQAVKDDPRIAYRR